MIINDREKLATHVETRVKGSRLVPYVTYEKSLREKIVEIAVGPAADSRAVDAVIAFLGKHKALHIKVRKSEIPYNP